MSDARKMETLKILLDWRGFGYGAKCVQLKVILH
jgi:hypothetical protein